MKKSAPSPRPVFRRDFLENVFGLLAATGLGASLSAADRQPAKPSRRGHVLTLDRRRDLRGVGKSWRAR